MRRVDELIQLAILDKRIQRKVTEMTGRPTTSGFRVNDKRTQEPGLPAVWQDLRVADPLVAGAIAQMPVEQAVPAEKPAAYVPAKDDVKYDLRPLKLHWGEYLRHHSLKKEATDWTDAFKKLLPGVVGDANLLVVGDREVARFRRDARLNVTRLKAEQPDIVKRYTRIKAEEVFDEEAFRAEMPDVHAAYRGRSLRLVTKGGVPIALPN